MSLGDECGRSGVLQPASLQWSHDSLFQRQSRLFEWSHCLGDELRRPYTTVVIMLARTWKLRRTCASNLHTTTRIANFRHREIRIQDNPTPQVSPECLLVACSRMSAGIATIKSGHEHGGNALLCTIFSNERSGGMDLLCWDVRSTYAWHEDTVIGPGTFATKSGRPCSTS